MLSVYLSFCLSIFCLSASHSPSGVSCILYPSGWSSSEVRHVCGAAAREFAVGDCEIWWGFYAVIAGGIANLVAALLTMLYEVSARLRRKMREVKWRVVFCGSCTASLDGIRTMVFSRGRKEDLFKGESKE